MHAKLKKYVCCTVNVTIATRIIGFIGILVSMMLITVLVNDKYFDNKANYELSRNIALAFGLDWQHFHHQASTAHHKDPEGRMISVIVIFYASFFLVLNLLLYYSTIKGSWRCAVPWLVCEFLGCASKFGALIFHLCNDPDDISNIFLIGSVLYIVTITWWWTVVFVAQLSWRYKTDSVLGLELSDVSYPSKDSQDFEVVPGKIRALQDIINDTENIDSPRRYSPNKMYGLI